MSDLSIGRDALERGTSQLPVWAYFDESQFRQEQERLFARGPQYVGHELCVPDAGDFHTLGHEGDGRVLVRNSQGVQLLSNVCRHRQAVMLRGRGNTGANVVCPLHRWTYDLDGTPDRSAAFRRATPAWRCATTR
jgi:choline monooxygenase